MRTILDGASIRRRPPGCNNRYRVGRRTKPRKSGGLLQCCVSTRREKVVAGVTELARLQPASAFPLPFRSADPTRRVQAGLTHWPRASEPINCNRARTPRAPRAVLLYKEKGSRPKRTRSGTGSSLRSSSTHLSWVSALCYLTPCPPLRQAERGHYQPASCRDVSRG